MRFLLIILLGLAVATAAKSDGILNPTMQSIGAYDGINNFTTSAAPPVCANDAPDGTVDLSKCSNAFYVAVIF